MNKLKHAQDNRDYDDYYDWKHRDEFEEVSNGYDDYYDWKHRKDDY